MSRKHQTLGEFIIENQSSFKYTSGELSRLINSIRLAAKVVNYEVNKAGLVDVLGAAGESNIQGEEQQKLDVYCLLYTSPSPRDRTRARMQSSA